jgi:hypothetical protein
MEKLLFTFVFLWLQATMTMAQVPAYIFSAMPDSSVHTNSSDVKSTKEINEKDSKSYLIKSYSYRWDTYSWIPDDMSTYENDSNGRPLVVKTYSATGTMTEKSVYSYIGNGIDHFTMVLYTSETGMTVPESTSEVVIAYDNGNKPKTITIVSSSEELTATVTVSFTYEGNTTYSKQTVEMMGTTYEMSATKTTLMQAGNPTVYKMWNKQNSEDYVFQATIYDYFNGGSSNVESITKELLKERIDIYTLQGQLVSSGMTVPQLPSGIYLLKMGKKSIKINIK